MWMADKPLPQENLAAAIASILNCFENTEVSIRFFAMFLKTMSNEWLGIDQWRIDKFMMLVRKMTREMLVILQKSDWNVEMIEKFSNQLKQTIMQSATPRGLFMHFTDLYMEEIAKVGSWLLVSSDRIAFTIEILCFVGFWRWDYNGSRNTTARTVYLLHHHAVGCETDQERRSKCIQLFTVPKWIGSRIPREIRCLEIGESF